MKHLMRLIPYLGRYKSGIIMGVVFVIGTNALAAMTPWIIGRTVDTIGARIGMEFVIPLIAFFMLFVTLEGILRYYMRRVLIGISRLIEYDLRNDFFASVQRFSMVEFDSIRTGEIMSRASNDLANVRMVLGPGIMYTAQTITMLAFVLTIMFNISWELTLLSLIPLPILSVVILKASRLLHDRFAQVQDDLATLTTEVQENISGIRVVKGHCRENNEVEDFLVKSGKLRDSNLSAARIFSGFMPFMMTFGGLSTVVILYFGGHKVAGGAITLGDLVAFFAYLGLLIWPMISLGWVMNLFQRGSASMGKINDLMDIKPNISNPSDGVKIEAAHGSIAFRNVSFRYEEDGPIVLDKIDLDVKPGETVAIVGPTGCGKSTLLRLISRLYDPSEGAILFEGVDLREADLPSLRSNIGYVPQETFLFSESVAENIAFGAHGHDIDRKEIERAAAISRLSNDIAELKDGYDTLLGERGINMSGGQKQRTAIARAIAGNPTVLLLDDCLSAVDTNTEQEILKGLKGEIENRTALIVSHRMSSIMHADQIIVLEDGKITDQGTHDELLQHGGLYADLWRKQQLSEELGVADAERRRANA